MGLASPARRSIADTPGLGRHLIAATQSAAQRKTGASLDADFNPRAFSRRAGVMTDLNTLVQANSPLYLLLACSINSASEITGLALDPISGELHGYVATPVDGPEPLNQSRALALPKAAREKLQSLGLGRFGYRIAARK